MTDARENAGAENVARRVRRALSAIALLLALGAVASAWFLISPAPGREYPGARPWSDFSILRSLTELMSLGGRVVTERGVEIKDFAFHLAAALGLLLLAGRALASAGWELHHQTAKRAWFYAQALLTAWVGVSLYSAWWSSDAAISLGQGVLYAFAIAWAVALAWTLERRHVPALLGGIVGISAIGAALCIWYFFERNPYHNPGFPLGNPGTLAACTVPAILIAGSVIAGAAWRAFRERKPPEWPIVVGAGLALVPLVWCLVLTHALSARVGLLVGVVAIVFLRAGRRVRWAVGGGVLLALIAAVWWSTTSDFERFTADRPTLRFRQYSWRYATEMWEQRQYFGAGAGAYTLKARQLGVADRMLDPAAFMGTWTAHAHNELFEVLAEIGLLGGLTFVGGFVATLIAAIAVLRKERSDTQRWLLIGLMAGLLALMADLMFSVGLRLPGEPALFYTLLGTIWAWCRAAAQSPRVSHESTIPKWLGPKARRLAVAAAAVVLTIVATWLAVRNWSGVLDERAAYADFRAGELSQTPGRAEALVQAALARAESAEARLLDPPRRLFAHALIVNCHDALARLAFDAFARQPPDAEPSPTSAPSGTPTTKAVIRDVALGRCHAAYSEAVRLDRRAPSILRMPAFAARSAARLAELYASSDSELAREWQARKSQAWLIQKRYDPYDVETTLALCDRDSPLRLADRVALLRDALRAGPQSDEQADEWLAAFTRVAREPGFEHVLELFLISAAPLDPKTDLNSLTVSMAPEAFRLAAHWHKIRGRYEEAERLAGRAARLYEPMRPRFPRLASTALAEQAANALRADPRRPMRAVELLRAAIDKLPRIQSQEYDRIARPFRIQLARYLLVAGQKGEAERMFRRVLGPDADLSAELVNTWLRTVEVFLRLPSEDRPDVRPWIDEVLRRQPANIHAWYRKAWLEAEKGDLAAVDRVLGEARAGGVSPDDVERLRNRLCLDFPGLCAQDGQP